MASHWPWFDLHADNCSSSISWDHPDHPRVCCVVGGGSLGINGTAVEAEGAGLATGIGIIVGLMSSIFINLGQNLQAIGAKEPGADTEPCSSRTWIKGVWSGLDFRTVWLMLCYDGRPSAANPEVRGSTPVPTGLTLFICGSIGNMVAMAFASATILVPLESSQFVTNVFFSKFINETHVSGRQWLGTWLAVLGTVFTCVFGPNDDRCFNIDMMISFWTAPGWIIYVIFTFSLSGLGWLMYGKLLAASKTEHPPQIAEVGCWRSLRSSFRLLPTPSDSFRLFCFLLMRRWGCRRSSPCRRRSSAARR